jgi:hypothetical protein
VSKNIKAMHPGWCAKCKRKWVAGIAIRHTEEWGWIHARCVRLTRSDDGHWSWAT